MGTKALLVTMAGYPMAPSCFMPDNGLAQLAACLLNNGHDALIIDLNTPELMDRLLPQSIREILAVLSEEKLYGTINREKSQRLRELESCIALHQKNEFYQLGLELAQTVRIQKADWVGFKLWNGDGFSGSMQMVKALKGQIPAIPVIAGGSHVDFFGEYLADLNTGFDFFCIREAELSVKK